MKAAGIQADLERRAPGDWELYRKQAESRELTARGPHRATAVRREEGWAARWRQDGALRFASASNPALLAAAIGEASAIPVAAAPPLDWPRGTSDIRTSAPEAPAPPDLLDELARLVSIESRGEALVRELTLRRGQTVERITNGRGLDVSLSRNGFDGVARAVGRRATRSCEARIVFRSDGEPDLTGIARRLADRGTLPLSDKTTPVSRGEWLLDPSVAAALLAAVAPLFCGETAPRWVQRSQLFASSVSIVDDAAADAPVDDEGTPTRRVVVVDRGAWRSMLFDLSAASRAAAASTGHGVRSSYRTPPAAGPRRLFFEAERGAAPLDMLASVRRGLFASALTAPFKVDFGQDRFEAEFTGVAVISGRALGPVAGARASGRLSELLRRIAGVGSDRQFFPMPYPAGAPTLLIERASFD
jgi:predicted Zn-dependent protease